MMWCDKFDIDLYNLIADSRKILESAKEIHFKTHGGVTDGKLDHPSVWNSYNGMIAFFGFDNPCKPESYWTDKKIIDCTLEEAIRDCWLHNYVIILEGKYRILEDFFDRTNLHLLMNHIRKIEQIDEDEISQTKLRVLKNIIYAINQVSRIKEIKDKPIEIYFI